MNQDLTIAIGEDYADIREAVRKVCADFQGPYWRDLEANEAYPTAFVQALTKSGFLSALIPQAYGGSGMPLRAAAVILEEIHASGLSRADVHHGNGLAPWQRGSETTIPACDRQW